MLRVFSMYSTVTYLNVYSMFIIHFIFLIFLFCNENYFCAVLHSLPLCDDDEHSYCGMSCNLSMLFYYDSLNPNLSL